MSKEGLQGAEEVSFEEVWGEARISHGKGPTDGSVSGEFAEWGGRRGRSGGGEALSPRRREDWWPGVCTTLEAIVRVFGKTVTGSDVPSGRITSVTKRTVRLLHSS